LIPDAESLTRDEGNKISPAHLATYSMQVVSMAQVRVPVQAQV